MKGLPSIDDVDGLADLAEQALGEGEEERAIPVLAAAAERQKNALLWQWTALLQRSLDDHEDALRSFGEASRLAPSDSRIAHGLAQTAMEAGLDAVGLFERARLLAPQDGSILVGLAAARTAAGEGDPAANDLRSILERAPMWTYGHEQLAQLLAVLGRSSEATSSVEGALKRFPSSSELWKILLNIELKRRNFESLGQAIDRAGAAGVRSPELRFFSAVHAAELSNEARPAALFGGASREMGPALDVWRVRHLLRLGLVDEALPLIESGLAGPQSEVLWPYAAAAWRLSGDERLEWLESQSGLIQIFDLSSDLPPMDQLATSLRSLHRAKAEFLDQSVRGGTQTDGPLFSRIDPVIRRLRSAIVKAVETYREKLPPLDPKHPLLKHRRDRRVRFSGSWSVRLRSSGHHSNHVHPQGWISSALYVALPTRSSAEAEDAGWLTIGQPDEEMQLNMAPVRKIEPKPGQLVLFPSWMWHGTLPFSQGERLTVAFDVQPPI